MAWRLRLILLQLGALTLLLAAAAVAPDAWSLVLASALIGASSSVAQQIVPFAVALAEPSRRGSTVGTRNRLNTVFMGGMFLGGAVGSAGAILAWRLEEWSAVCAFGGALAAIALGLHAHSQRHRARRS